MGLKGLKVIIFENCTTKRWRQYEKEVVDGVHKSIWNYKMDEEKEGRSQKEFTQWNNQVQWDEWIWWI